MAESEMRLGLFDLPEFGRLLEGPRRPRAARRPPVWASGGRRRDSGAGAPRSRLAVLLEVARRGTEVVVKVTGSNREAGPLRAHLQYLQRRAEGPIEDEQGTLLDPTPEAVRRVMRNWGAAVAEGRRNEALGAAAAARRPTIAVHLTLSMPRATRAEAVRRAARVFAREELTNHPHVMVLHTDKDHPHVHIVVNNLGNDLRRLPRSRGDLQRWREVFARGLREQGVEAAATTRRSRGVIRKGETAAIWHGKQRLAAAGAPSAALRVFRAQIEQAENELRGAWAPNAAPAAERARANRSDYERALVDAVSTLATQGEQGRLAAQQLAPYVERLPPAETTLDVLKRRLLALRERNPEGPNLPSDGGAGSERSR